MRQQGAAVRQGPQNYAGTRIVQPPQQARPAWSGANPVAAKPQITAGPFRGPTPAVSYSPAPQQGVRENRAWGAAQGGQGNVYLGGPANPVPASPVAPPSANPHGPSRPGLPLPPPGARPGGSGGFVPFNPAPPQSHGPSYVPGPSASPMPTFGGKGGGAPGATPFVPQGYSNLGMAGPTMPAGGVSGLMGRRVETAPNMDRGPLQQAIEKRTVWDDVADQLGLSGNGATSGNEVEVSGSGTSAASEQDAGRGPTGEGQATNLGAGASFFGGMFGTPTAEFAGGAALADGSGPLGQAAGSLVGLLGDPLLGAARAMNRGERGVVRDYYDQFKDLDANRRFGESMLDPDVQAAQEQAAREGMRSEIDRQRDAALRMGASQASRGGRQGGGWDQGIYGEALRNTQQGERDLVMDAFKRKLSAGQLGASTLSDRANTIYDKMAPGYTSPKDLAAMMMEAFPDLVDALIPDGLG